MSLGDFQRALADLVANPAMCLAVRRHGSDALDSYELTPREHRRLESVVWQRGMSANCTVYRSTRATPIYTLLQNTCDLLGPSLTHELNEYWMAFPRMEVRFDLEISRFADFLAQRLKSGVVECSCDSAAITEVLAIELARETERLRPRDEHLPHQKRAARFRTALPISS
jgi:hypothetical protein